MIKAARESDTRGKWKRIAAPAAGGEVAGVSPEMAAAMVPEQMLHEDEEILLLVKPSPLFILLTSFRFLVVVVLAAVLAVRLLVPQAYMSANNVAWIAVGAALARLIWGLLVWTSHTYMLTNQRIITIKGVVNVAVVSTNLRKVQRTTLYLPWWQRIFGLGGIGIATAATESFDATWVMLGRPVEVHEKMMGAIRKVQ